MGKKPNSQLSNKCRKYAVYNLDKLSCRPVGYTGILMYSQIGCTAHSFRIIIVTYFLLVKKWLLYALPPNPTSPSNRQTQKFSPAWHAWSTSVNVDASYQYLLASTLTISKCLRLRRGIRDVGVSNTPL